jgi:hypothetical protein
MASTLQYWYVLKELLSVMSKCTYTIKQYGRRLLVTARTDTTVLKLFNDR